MIQPKLIEKAYEFAKLKHSGQLDDENKPYFYFHILNVVDILKRVTIDPVIIAAAFLHDTVEDCGVTWLQLADEFGEEVADLVLEVTHEGKKDKYGYYFPRLYSQKAIMIKFADRLSNISRMDAWDIDRQEHYLKRSKFWKCSPKDRWVNGK